VQHTVPPGPRGRRRPGKILALFVLLLPVLLGLLGLVIDGGLLMSAYRQSQNAADAAATAAALDKLRGSSNAIATATATAYAQTFNNLAGATVTTHIPPASGPYAGNSQYVEVIVTYPVATFFIQVLGVNPHQQVQARAVAGYEATSPPWGVAALDPNAIPGLALTGGSRLKVNGGVVVNSQGAGSDQNGNPVDLGFPPYAATVGGGTLLQASDVQVVGGVDVPANIQNLPGTSANPLHAGVLPKTDPLLNLPTPTTANGVVNTFWQLNSDLTWTPAAAPQDVSVSISAGQSVTFQPGIYKTISVTGTGPGSVTFSPGIYVIGPQFGGGGQTLNITTGSGVTVAGSGVMFYNTGSDYTAATGSPDSGDGGNSPSPPASTNFGSVNISGQSVNLQAATSTGGPFDGLLFYQRRWNTQPVSIQGNGGSTSLGGTFYAKWANFQLTGTGTYNAQFLSGRTNVTGGANLTINSAGSRLGKANEVFLVE
jgi:Flp pilus assembly protein TadG